MRSEVAFLDKGGRFVVPARFRKLMGWDSGDKLMLEVVDGELRVVSVRQAIKSAQELVAQRVPQGLNLVDELIRERREEALRDENENVSLSSPVEQAHRELKAARG